MTSRRQSMYYEQAAKQQQIFKKVTKEGKKND
jgi:hypothetical protein